MGKPPKVKIQGLKLIESRYVDDDGYKYSAVKLLEASKKYKVFNFPLAAINLWEKPFSCNNLDYFIFQMQRVQKADLKFPIILDSNGQVADGWHRVVKAILKGDRTIKAIRLEEMPDFDSKEEK